MTALRRYLMGLAAVGIPGIVATRLARPALRDEIAAGVVIGLLVQAPLGWWTLRSIGTGRFQLVWVGGMVLRLALMASPSSCAWLAVGDLLGASRLFRGVLWLAL